MQCAIPNYTWWLIGYCFQHSTCLHLVTVSVEFFYLFFAVFGVLGFQHRIWKVFLMMILIKVEQYGSTFEDDCDYSLPTYILPK